jgi:hypothetical protein
MISTLAPCPMASWASVSPAGSLPCAFWLLSAACCVPAPGRLRDDDHALAADLGRIEAH